MTESRPTIEEFGIVRREEESHHLQDYTYLIPFAGPMTEDFEWTNHQIHHPNDVDSWGLHQYAINNSKKIYVLFSAFLLSARAEDGRKTMMRLWQMIVANWINAGNTPGSLRYLGISLITNVEGRELLAIEWQYQLDQGRHVFGTAQQRMLTILRANSLNTWSHNTFVRSGLRVAESLSSVGRTLTLDKVHLIKIPERGGGLVVWNLVLEFKDGDAGRENYREKLIRSLIPMIDRTLEFKEKEREIERK